jgi:hypothetical protein
MSIFKNRFTEDVLTVFGVNHDHYANRADYELVNDDRDGVTDTAPQPEVLDDEPSEAPETSQEAPEPTAPETNTADQPSDNPRSSK